MSSFTTLVNTDPSPISLIEFLGAQLKDETATQRFVDEAKKYVLASNGEGLIAYLLKKIDLILGLDTDENVEGAFDALFSIMYTLGEHSIESNKVVTIIIRAITADKSKSPAALRRLNALVALFNLVFNVESKYLVLESIFVFAAETDQNALVSHFHSRVNEWIAAWNLKVDQQRRLLVLIAQALTKNQQSDLALKINIRYFQTFKNEPINSDVNAAMKAAVVVAIDSPVNAFHGRIALLETIQSLKAGAQWSNLLNLLKIVCDGNVDEFISFKSISASVFYENNLNVAAIEEKIKLLALCSLSAQAANRVLTFQAISNALRISIDEVELWVIEAISQNLIDGSIDQLNSTVTVTHFAYKAFGASQWKSLQQKLRELRKNMSVVAEGIAIANNKSAV